MPASALSTISIALTGSGGAGVMTAGQILVNATAKAGYYGLMGKSFGPQIRGGEAAALLRLSSRPVETPGNYFDIMFAFDWGNIERFAGELPMVKKSLVLYDSKYKEVPEMIKKTGARIVPFPLTDLANKVKGGRINMVGMGVVASLIGLKPEYVIDTLSKALARKGQDVLDASIEAFNLGYEEAKDIPSDHTFRAVPKEIDAPRISITGNEAAGCGALNGGVRFVAAYPITPATEILEWMAPNLSAMGGTLVQAEDELASINMILGGSFGGVPSLTATSGPGLALMTESIGLALAAEIPCVIVNVQRGGPSTGIPTKSEQSDFNIAMYGLHGDAPHIVLAPASVSDCLFTTQWAVYLAEKTQSPVIVLSEQALGQTRVILDQPLPFPYATERKVAGEEDFKNGYLRYKLTDDGVSPMAIPGTPGGEHVADGLEHIEQGIPSTKASVHQEQLDKRQNKLTNVDYSEFWAQIAGEGELAVITFGSVSGVAHEALLRSKDDERFKLIAMRLLSPIQPELLAKELEGVKKVLVVEQNHQGQFYRYLRGHYDLPGEVRSFARPGPLPIRFNELMAEIAAWR